MGARRCRSRLGRGPPTAPRPIGLPCRRAARADPVRARPAAEREVEAAAAARPLREHSGFPASLQRIANIVFAVVAWLTETADSLAALCRSRPVGPAALAVYLGRPLTLISGVPRRRRRGDASHRKAIWRRISIRALPRPAPASIARSVSPRRTSQHGLAGDSRRRWPVSFAGDWLKERPRLSREASAPAGRAAPHHSILAVSPQDFAAMAIGPGLGAASFHQQETCGTGFVRAVQRGEVAAQDAPRLFHWFVDVRGWRRVVAARLAG